MADKTITAVNSVFLLTVRGLYRGQRLQGYSADAAFDTDSADAVETMVGVDGIMSAGYVPITYAQPITLNADSESLLVFENWFQTMKAQGEVLYADAVITLPAVQRKYICTRGVLSGYKPMSDVRRTLQPRPMRITWQDISPAPYSVLPGLGG